NEESPIEVREAYEGAELAPGSVLIARAGRHLTFSRQEDGRVRAHLDVAPLDLPHRPSVDVLFKSAAETYGGRVLGVVMTGMGNDGLAGAAAIKARGGRLITESEETCVVYGMPRAIVEAGLSDRSVPLDQMARAIISEIAGAAATDPC
ncbi:MAG: CheB methylesterase domain-containing protein, partial [Verrucomicrobiia bacterium]